MSDTGEETVVRKKKQAEQSLRLLAACFYEPEKALLVEEHVLENLRESLGGVCPEAVGSVECMQQAILSCSDEELKVAYAKLFVGPFSLAAAPYGSVHLDEGARVMGDSTMEVIKWYEQEGLAKSDDCKDLPDHIAVELEFVSYLMSKEIAAIETSNPSDAAAYEIKRRDFAETLLCPWVPEFCHKIQEGTDNAFYVALAECLSTVTASAPVK
ncbi:MAG: molecular chaperone TorD family protein [Verrucomicrobia bacterium]|nr:molecular chaperone TorD family protein [Verrucomicrobiota bacterium]MBT7069216.1 molecular chaperone TorD family protein [Verrucomicrobiota bacterium]MBT7700214.1 molecular chaperone TorD family protein [Verrucomicrobiota bacterium]